jgi:phospholipid/cholesterol/gamma-HCH transport system substrate-binding protein
MKSLVIAVPLLLISSCALGSGSYEVTARFADVLDLVLRSAVKVNDVSVGTVEQIRLAPDGWSALVTMTVDNSVHLPADADAYLRQSSLLGEKFVELAAPAHSTTTTDLRGGDTIPLTRTNRNPQVEEVLGALSMLLNGGGVAQLQTITSEVDKALAGNGDNVRSLLRTIDATVTQLDDHRDDITRALDGIAKLSTTLNDRKQRITGALDGLTPGIAILAQQRDALTTMVNALGRLSTVAVDTVTKSKDDLVADLKAMRPTLRQLASAGQTLPQALQVLLTYPFPDSVLAGIKNDYLNVYLNDKGAH